MRYHPTASGVLASAALDLTVKIWDINSAKALITLSGHTEQVGLLLRLFSYFKISLDLPSKHPPLKSRTELQMVQFNKIGLKAYYGTRSQ